MRMRAAPATLARRSSRGNGEARLFRVAMAVIALAVVDDGVGYPEPGTTADDHPASVLVPLVLAAALAWAYPRLRPGLRGIAAMTCGTLALTAGIADGFRHVLVDRFAGDDATAMLAGMAGALLIGLGIRTLWRSRRGGSRVRRYARRTAIGIGVIAGGFLVLFPATFAIVATHRAREPVTTADLGRPYERVSFETSDGLRLAGWYVPSRNGAAIIVSPGRSGPAAHARMLARRGYGVLLFDRRGEGESEGDFNGFGWAGERDISAAAGFLARRAEVEPGRIGGLGLSVGGEMLIHAAAQDHRLRAVVSEGAGARSLAEHWDDPDVSELQRPFTNVVVQTAAVAVLGNEAPPPSLADLVGRIAPRPLLLIRGLAGQEQERLNRTYYDAALPPKSLWEVPGAHHTAAIAAAPREYERRVVGFFDAALLTG